MEPGTLIAHAAIGHAQLNFPGWTDFIQSGTLRDMARDARAAISKNRFSDERSMSQESLDAHVIAYAKSKQAAALSGMREFRALVVPRGDVARDPATRQTVLTGRSRAFQRWIEETCGDRTELRATEDERDRLGLHAVSRYP